VQSHVSLDIVDTCDILLFSSYRMVDAVGAGMAAATEEVRRRRLVHAPWLLILTCPLSVF
jgi:hypothetical protein